MSRQRRAGAKEWIPLASAARLYEGHISRLTLWRLARAGALKSRRIGREWDLFAADLHRYMNDPAFNRAITEWYRSRRTRPSRR